VAAGKNDNLAASIAADQQRATRLDQAMTIIWIMFVCSVVLLPATALLALRWAARHGAFEDFQKTALSIFDEEEPVGRLSDRFPEGGANKKRPQP
jgi:nitrogen fixation-related uncharacterized protein